MDTNNSGQNNQNGSEQKPILSWSQPSNSQPTSNQTPTQLPQTTISTPAQNEGGVSGKAVAWILGVVVIAAVIGLIVIGARGKGTPATGTTATTTPSTSATGTSATKTPVTGGVAAVGNIQGLTVPSPQDAGKEVVVSVAKVSAPTWVVVYENRNGQAGNVLGAGYFSPSLNTGSIPLLRATVAGQTYLIGETKDDGDRVFTFHKDLEVRDENGKLLLIEFKTR